MDCLTTESIKIAIVVLLPEAPFLLAEEHSAPGFSTRGGRILDTPTLVEDNTDLSSLGLDVQALDAELAKTYRLRGVAARGVVVTGVEPHSAASFSRRPVKPFVRRRVATCEPKVYGRLERLRQVAPPNTVVNLLSANRVIADHELGFTTKHQKPAVWYEVDLLC